MIREFVVVKDSITKLDHRMTEEIAKLDNRITTLDNHITKEIASIKVQIADFRAEAKSDIATQTKWIVTVFLAGTVLYPMMEKIIHKFF